MKTGNYLLCWKSLLYLVGLLLCAQSTWAKCYHYEENRIHYSFSENNIYYRIISETDKKVAVTYQYDVWDVCDEDRHADELIGAFSNYSGNIVIPQTVVHNSVTYDVFMIDAEAFYDCASLISLTLPQSITSIGKQAFDGCINLRSINIPKGVTSIGTSAFYGCI